MSCSFHCVNLAPSRLNLFPIYFLFDAIVNGVVFLISFLDCSIIKIQKYNWFLYVDFVSCKFLNLPLAKCLCDFLRIFLYMVLCNLSTEIVWLLPFQSVCLLFPFLALLHWQKLSALYWISSESRHPWLVPDLRWTTFIFSPLNIVSCRFSIDVLYCIEEFPLYAYFLSLLWMGVEFCHMLCLHQLLEQWDFFSFSLIMWQLD